jgi:hypothetical protein
LICGSAQTVYHSKGENEMLDYDSRYEEGSCDYDETGNTCECCGKDISKTYQAGLGICVDCYDDEQGDDVCTHCGRSILDGDCTCDEEYEAMMRLQFPPEE